MANFTRCFTLVTLAAVLCAFALAAPVAKKDAGIDTPTVRKQDDKADSVVPDPENDILDRLAKKIKELRALKIVDVTAALGENSAKTATADKSDKDSVEKKPVAVPVIRKGEKDTDNEEFEDKAVVKENEKEAKESEKAAEKESGAFALKLVSRLAFEPKGSDKSFLTDEEREGLRSYINHKKIMARRSRLMLLPTVRVANPPPLPFLTQEENEGHYKYLAAQRLKSAIGTVRMAVDSDLEDLQKAKKANGKDEAAGALDLQTAQRVSTTF